MTRIIAVLVLIVICGGSAAAQQPVAFERSTLTVITVTGKHRFNIEVAQTRPQLSRGLMFRRSLAANAGMLFDFGTDGPISMWMKNTYIPLDMVFIDRDGRVTSIHYGAVPRSLSTIASDGPVRAVFEIKAGVAKLLGIKPGDQVVHAMFAQPKAPVPLKD